MTTTQAKGRARPTEPTALTEPDLTGLTDAAVEKYMAKERERHVSVKRRADQHKLNYLVAADELVRVRKTRPVQPLAKLMGISQQTLSEALRSRWDKLRVNFSADRRPEVPERKAHELERAGWVQFTNDSQEQAWYLPGKREHAAEDFQGWTLDQAFRAMAYRGQTAAAIQAAAEKAEVNA